MVLKCQTKLKVKHVNVIFTQVKVLILRKPLFSRAHVHVVVEPDRV